MLSRTWLRAYTHGCVRARSHTHTHTHTCKLFKTRTLLCLLLQSHCLPQTYCAVLTVTQLGLSLSNTIDCGSPGSSVHGVLRQEYWRGLPCPSPGYLPHPGSEPTSLVSPALEGGFFTTAQPGKPAESLHSHIRSSELVISARKEISKAV